MNLELDHFFILVEPEANVADRLLSLGMKEGPSNTHPGQGTSNRRFYFTNAMLELLWVRDKNEADVGPGHKLYFPKRTSDSLASPFGLVLTRTDNHDLNMPFAGWSYQPDYFPAPNAFHIGDNSDKLIEPLCIYVPFVNPLVREINTETFASIKEVRISTPSNPLSEVLVTTASADRLTIQSGDQHLMEIYFVGAEEGRSNDLRPELPVIIYW